MDLKANMKSLVGKTIGVEGTIYRTWEGDILKGVSPAHAEQLLEMPNGFKVVGGPKQPLDQQPPSPPPQDPPKAPDAPSPADPPEPASAASTDAQGLPVASTPDLGDDPEDEEEIEEEEYGEEELKQLTKADLLDFLDETQKKEAAKLPKDAIIKLILEGE